MALLDGVALTVNVVVGTVSTTGARFWKSTVWVTPPPAITLEPSPLFGPTL